MALRKRESKLFVRLRKHLKNIYFTRIESSTIQGIPDVHGVGNGKSFWIELKSTDDSFPKLSKFQQAWCNRAYNTFKDYDKYILLIYLFRQVWQNYADNFNYYSLDEFYSNNEFVIDKINLIQISEELHIPKETIRRKVNEFQNEGILKRNGKTIILNKEAVNHQKPVKTVKLLSHFIYKKSLDLQTKEQQFYFIK